MLDQDSDNLDVLSEEEKDILTEQLAEGMGELTEDDESAEKLRIVFEWAERARVDASVLNMVLERRLLVTVTDSAVSFAVPGPALPPVADKS